MNITQRLRCTSIYFILLALLPLQTSAQALSKYQTEVPGIDCKKISVYIEDLRSGEVVLDVNGEEQLIPASITKVVTAATAFQKCNLDETFRTDVVAYGRISKTGELDGNITIKACGDPTIESAYFSEYQGVADSIAKAIAAKGIKRIKGRIIIDEPEWLIEPIPAGWVSEDVNYPYGTGHHAMNYKDNVMTLKYSRGGDYTLTPATPEVVIKPSSGRAGAWRARDSKIYNVSHNSGRPLSVRLANPAPASSFKAALTDALATQNITIDNTEIHTDGCAATIYTHRSPTIYNILRSLILRSDNQMAEAMLRYAWPGLSRANATQNELQFWNKRGVDLSDCSLEDGSGLSRSDRITAYGMADLLVWMVDNDKNFIRFINMLPKAGKSGTLKSFLKGTPLEGRFLAKTGSMSGVQCYAGYAVDQLGVPTHVVVIMVNGFRGDRSKLKTRLQNLLIEKIKLN